MYKNDDGSFGAFALLPAVTRLMIQRRMHYSPSRASAWFANMGPEHAANMVSDWYGGFGTSRDIIKARNQIHNASVRYSLGDYPNQDLVDPLLSLL